MPAFWATGKVRRYRKKNCSQGSWALTARHKGDQPGKAPAKGPFLLKPVASSGHLGEVYGIPSRELAGYVVQDRWERTNASTFRFRVTTMARRRGQDEAGGRVVASSRATQGDEEQQQLPGGKTPQQRLKGVLASPHG